MLFRLDSSSFQSGKQKPIWLISSENTTESFLITDTEFREDLKIYVIKNQLDALFVLSLFRHLTSTCFGYICSPSSGGMLCIYRTIGTCCAFWLTVCWESNWCWLCGRKQSIKSTTRTNCCIYTVYLLMTGYKYARTM